MKLTHVFSPPITTQSHISDRKHNYFSIMSEKHFLANHKKPSDAQRGGHMFKSIARFIKRSLLGNDAVNYVPKSSHKNENATKPMVEKVTEQPYGLSTYTYPIPAKTVNNAPQKIKTSVSDEEFEKWLALPRNEKGPISVPSAEQTSIKNAQTVRFSKPQVAKSSNNTVNSTSTNYKTSSKGNGSDNSASDFFTIIAPLLDNDSSY
jgi:hypothetical protein